MLFKTENQRLKAAYQNLIDGLKSHSVGGYQSNSPHAAEPTAWAGLVLNKAGHEEEAIQSADWLASLQQPDGSVGVTIDQKRPAWPTSLAILLWQSVDALKYQASINNGINWALDQTPWTRPKHENFGHDTMLEGWSWAADTHSWVEPTAFFVKALNQVGRNDLPRFNQAKALLVDRLLPSGGANYGNTIMLGQELLQHLQPTGIVAWTLADFEINDDRMDRSLDYLVHALTQPTGITSLSFGLLGIASNRDRYNKQMPIDVYEANVIRATETISIDNGIYKPALLALAMQECFGFKASSESGLNSEAVG